MPQETNLNVSPYFDDFDANKNFYKVLFKPGYPVQSRELTTLQSILQNQVEQFGNHIFQEGSPVIDGQISNDSPFPAIQIEDQFNGAPISIYFEQILGKKIRGATSNVVAIVQYLLDKTNSDNKNYTLYLNYLQSGGDDFTTRTFVDGETLLLEEPLTYGNFTIQTGQGVCNTIATNASTSGSSVAIKDGVYFARGYFAKVESQRILLDQYSTNPSYKVGLQIVEQVVTADEDETLFDNAQGFSNYSAPGADRFKIVLELTKKSLDDTDTGNFIELLRLLQGVPQYFSKKSEYSLIRDELARRTADQSGDFYVKPFTLFARDNLNDRLVNTTGVYYDDQTTIEGNTPSDDMMVYQIGPGKAYVNGYDVETISPKLLDVDKTRTTTTLSNQVISYNAGKLVTVNNSFGSATIGIGTTAVVSLMNSRLGSSKWVAAGTTIGYARVYDFIPESNYVDQTSRLNLRLYDIQTFTVIGLTTSITQTTPAFIKGTRSNASGYLKDNVSSGSSLTLYQVSGTFLTNEPITINGIDNGRLINSIVDYSIGDVKSVYSKIGVSTFNADLILDNAFYIAPTGTQFNITGSSGGISTVSSGLGTNFVNKISSGDLITYSNPTLGGNVVYNKVETVSAGGTNFTISALTTVNGVCAGNLPVTTSTVVDIFRLSSTLNSKDSSLLTKLPRENVSSIDLSNNQIIERRLFANQSFSGNSITVTVTDPDIIFESFDEDRFVITYSDGSVEPMRIDKYSLDTTGKQLTFNGLTKGSGTADVIATVRNRKPDSKIKKLNRANSIIVNYSKYSSSGIGTTTLNDGLTYSQVYGVRVQDDEICLNYPDVLRVLAVYESPNSSDPSLPLIQLGSFTGPTNNNTDFKIGENILGKTSGTIAVVVNKINTDKLEFVYLNGSQFTLNETIVGKESTTTAVILAKTLESNNITQNFVFDNGQKETFYDYSRIVRKKGFAEPKGKLKIVFQNYTIDSTDTGEFITVNSYAQNSYKNDIPVFNNTRLSDFIDVRPRVAPYSLTTRSPFEFNSRNFANDGQYSKYVLAPGENILASYSYYQPRVDRVFLNQNGTFEISQGVPSDNPSAPSLKSNALDIAKITIPPYVFNVKDVIVDMSKHKRYQMNDISLLEERILRVEEFTTLNALESKTENFGIKDAETGLDRFKCGFFVDNFTDHKFHDLNNPSFRSSIDKQKSTLRPLHYTTSLELQLGSEIISGVGNTYSPNADQSYVTDLGSPGIKKTGDLITLNYNEVVYNQQLLATRTESVTAFLVGYWSGSIQLNPSIDTWFDEKAVTSTSYNEISTTVIYPDVNVTVTQNVTDNVVYTNPPINNTGGLPYDYYLGNAKILTNNGRTQVTIGYLAGESRTLEIINGNTIRINGLHISQADYDMLVQYIPPSVAQNYINTMSGMGGYIDYTPPAIQSTTETTYQTDTTTSTKTTSDLTTVITPEQVNTVDTLSQSQSHYTEPVLYLRSRNIEFDATGLKPVTKFYSFFQGIDVSKYIIPKLLEVTMISGKFQIGETVVSDPHFTSAKISFRLCSPNHKSGPYNSPTDTFSLIPYNQQTSPTNYSESSTFLNVDTRSLELPSEVDFYGQIAPDMTLIGKTSGAVAKISNIRLVTDNVGRLIGSLFIPNPNIPENPMWINGENTFTLTDNSSLSTQPGAVDVGGVYLNQSSGNTTFTSSGTINVTDTNILTTRNITIIPAWNTNTTTITNTTTNTSAITEINTTTFSRVGGTGSVNIQQPYDPLAESFYVFEDTGIFLTSVEVYFNTKSTDMPVTLQIRPLVAGVPSNMVIPFSEVTLNPDQINLSTDGSLSTKFTFPSPVYLQGPQQQTVREAPIASNTQAEYAIVLLSNSPDYRVFITRLGEPDLQSGVIVSAQPTLGSLFKSQNGTTWNPSQYDDLKYKINRADFISNEGLLRFFNPKLGIGNQKVTVTTQNSFQPLSKKIIVGLGSTGYNATNVVPGVILSQGSASGTLTGIAGSITIGTGVTISNAGFGYTNGTFTGVSLVSETGYGQGATATVITSSSSVNSVSITSGGYGYQVGDSLLIPGLGQNVGFGAKVVVNSLGSNNAFVIDNVQGSFSVGITTISYKNSSGITTYVGAAVTISSVTSDQFYDGLHMRVSHINHGMHSPTNYVRISEMRPMNNDVNTNLSSSFSASQTTSISVVSGIGFTNFEGATVSSTNPGYVIIGTEVIKYTGVSGNTLTTLTRSIDNTQAQSYDSGIPVYKYEFNGVSLRRINKVHNFAEVDTANHPINLNSYYIKIDMDGTDFDGVGIGSNRANNLYFNKTLQTGESGTSITNNIQFESIQPKISSLIPAKTNISAQIRTFSGTSVGGNETSFLDNGFQNIPLNNITYFNSPNIICSDINESKFITGFPGNRSLTMQLLMTTTDSRVSPVIDTINVSAIFTSNLINNPVGILTASDYATNDSVRSLYNDKHNSIYISKPIRLKLPANSLKVMLSASKNNTNDIRVLYRLFRDDSINVSQNYELFPGYSNYYIDGSGIKRVIDPSMNDGSADTFVQENQNRSFKDYEYSIDDLPQFNAFAIKIVMAGTNQATPPMIKQLRTIATIKPTQ